MNSDQAFPRWLKMWWILSSPLALALAARIAWEKTFLTWQRGPQMVGFSLMHIHPGFAILGFLCCLSLTLWFLPAAIYFVKRREHATMRDVGMCIASIAVLVVMMIPDTFFA